MSFGVEFGTKSGADAAREEYAEHVCPLDDDKRELTVHFKDDTPEHVRDRVEAAAQTGRAEGAEGAGQADLTDAEKDRVGPFTGPNNYMKAASVKALLRENGVSDWEAWYDPTLTVDEHKSSVLPKAQQSGGGDRIENEGPDRDAAARAEKAAHADCDHARGFCENGDPEACEFLQGECGVPETEVKTLMEFGDGAMPYEELPGDEKGALDRSWTGYKVAVQRLASLLDEVAIELRHAERAAAAIDAIEEGITDMETEEFRALEAHHETLHRLHRRHPGDDHGQPEEGRVPTDDELASAEPEQPDQPIRPAAGPPPEQDEPAGTDSIDVDAVPVGGVPDIPEGAIPAEEEAPEGATAGALREEAEFSAREAREKDRRSVSDLNDEELFGELMERMNGDGENGDGGPVVEEGDDGQLRLAEDTEPEQDAPSEEHRRAQNNGYLRSGSRGFSDDASAREGLGQFTATGGEKTLDEYEEA